MKLKKNVVLRALYIESNLYIHNVLHFVDIKLRAYIVFSSSYKQKSVNFMLVTLFYLFIHLLIDTKCVGSWLRIKST